MNYTKRLDLTSKDDLTLVGGKAASLGQLIAWGVNVPPGFVITTAAYDAGSASHIPEECAAEIMSAFDSLGVPRVAVRSSAIAEDSTAASWAGQLESYLNIDKDNLLLAVQKCWQSI